MCGRVAMTKTIDELDAYLESSYEISQGSFDFRMPRYNIAPGEKLISVGYDGSNYQVNPLRWGLIPDYEQKETRGYINARVETIREKPSFKHAYKHQRCVLLIDGYYEWKVVGNEKIPHRIVQEDEEVFALAGIWSKNRRSDGSILFSTAIITTEAVGALKEIHNRMPLVLSVEQAKAWMSATYEDVIMDTKDKTQLKLNAYPVSTIVNNPRYDTIDCIKPRI